ncbi:PREDICTED: putative calcium-transporting ATPase 13, plasma membrane-type isoform X2 [Nelumbo nucifera]|uniref:Calcium-transporting ATPase n=1 Tax=Nelumbo nucifera TaxID=4432 RepID=A0A1U8BGI4_NELNU|nr:PREDICTED: putative calcium-transporting ATPase 13, plasma membrane-type isoform X2 [Nelumbo nucifera]
MFARSAIFYSIHPTWLPKTGEKNKRCYIAHQNNITSSTTCFFQRKRILSLLFLFIVLILVMSSDPLCAQGFDSATLFFPNNPTLTKSHKRWRLAYATIYSCRVFITLTGDIFAMKNQLFPSILRMQSYTAIDVSPHDGGGGNDNIEPFANVDQTRLIDLVKEKKLEYLHQFGGVEGLAKLLQTDVNNGIHGDTKDLRNRQNVFGLNTYKRLPAKGFFHFVVEGFKETTVLVILICSPFYLGVFTTYGLRKSLYSFASIILSILVIVSLSAVSTFWQSRLFDSISDESEIIRVDVVRGGKRKQVSIFDIVVGDVVRLKIGDQVPADGLLLDVPFSHVQVNGSSFLTGESDHVDINSSESLLLFSGNKVADRDGRMLVTAVGMNTAWGEMMSSKGHGSAKHTPLQARLNRCPGYYIKDTTNALLGIRGFLPVNTMSTVTIVVAAIPEGLPLIFTLTLFYCIKRMKADQVIVREPAACEIMSSVTVICADKTGTLTLNQMKVAEFWLGEEAMKDGTSEIAPEVTELLRQGVCLNTTDGVRNCPSVLMSEFSSSPTEKAILSWAMELKMDMDEVRQCCTVLHVEAFDTAKKRSGILIRKGDEKMINIHWKGDAEVILEMCSSYYLRSGSVKAIDEDKRNKFEQTIEDMAAKGLRCIALSHKKIPETEDNDNTKVHLKLEEENQTLLGLLGLKDPCQTGVSKAVEVCRNAGINIKMITGDHVVAAKASAIECGILQSDVELNNEAVVEGAEFRNYSEEERMDKIDRIQVMARSSPSDKLLMVQCLKRKGHVVAVTGNGINDVQALKEADIGFAVGIQGAEVVKESSDIIVLNNSFTSVAAALGWGRCLYNNIQMFIQFQFTVNISSLSINLIVAVFSGEAPLTAVQLLWVNLIMDALGAIALAAEQPTGELMERLPVVQNQPLITHAMWGNLIFQALYQVTIFLILQFKGRSVFGVNEKIKDTLIFNIFVLCQVFNLFNARKHGKKNIFKGIFKNRLFSVIIGITVVLQVVMVEFAKRIANTERLNWIQWVASIGFASVSWVIAWLVNCFSAFPINKVYMYLITVLN